jgi:hypothetical protein
MWFRPLSARPENLALEQRGQCFPVPRPIEQAQQPHDGIEQLVWGIADRDSRPCGVRGSRQVPGPGLQQQLRDDGRFESHPKTERGLARGGFDDLYLHREVYRGDEVLTGVVVVDALPQREALAAPGDYRQHRASHHVLRRTGVV